MVKTPSEIQQAQRVMEDYVQIGAAKKVVDNNTKFLVPWFVVAKMEESGKEKLRLISDCRTLNQFLHTKHFKLDHWKDIFPCLEKGMWAAKIDLKNA